MPESQTLIVRKVAATQILTPMSSIDPQNKENVPRSGAGVKAKSRESGQREVKSAGSSVHAGQSADLSSAFRELRPRQVNELKRQAPSSEADDQPHYPNKKHKRDDFGLLMSPHMFETMFARRTTSPPLGMETPPLAPCEERKIRSLRPTCNIPRSYGSASPLSPPIAHASPLAFSEAASNSPLRAYSCELDESSPLSECEPPALEPDDEDTNDDHPKVLASAALPAPAPAPARFPDLPRGDSYNEELVLLMQGAWANMKSKQEQCGSWISRHPEIDEGMREMLILWIKEVSGEYSFHPLTYYLAVLLLDQVMRTVASGFRSDQFQIMGAAALFLACKIQENMIPQAEDMLEFVLGDPSDGLYEERRTAAIALFEQYELEILMAFDFDIKSPTPLEWVSFYLQIAALLFPDNFHCRDFMHQALAPPKIFEDRLPGPRNPRGIKLIPQIGFEAPCILKRRYCEQKLGYIVSKLDGIVTQTRSMDFEKSILAASVLYMSEKDSLSEDHLRSITGIGLDELRPCLDWLARLGIWDHSDGKEAEYTIALEE
ncbi:Cyclin, N-terminal domain-containing protein [Polychytrium aggregatum]|uniref:Cyclin, N-terminal domain-containing protein n=1 Tax=Polychytrium aggregatum TaxID=110093 RepID=UPI0022FE030E|nr:Cyclin, N-terminal domain-containing protein [Polychytrium aggregatum]KAI9209704.1 Cyclin, N-terminal domain-containing protein [Polychytrium aggregatum]